MLSYAGVERNCADQYSLCRLFTVQEADCIRTWAGLARMTTATDLHAKGDLLVAACRETEHKNSLSAELFKESSTFDDLSCLQFLDWLCDPSNYGTASHGDVSRALQNIEVEYLVARQILHRRRAQNVKAGADLQWDVAKQANFWTSPDFFEIWRFPAQTSSDFAQYRECLKVDLNASDEHCKCG